MNFYTPPTDMKKFWVIYSICTVVAIGLGIIFQNIINDPIGIIFSAPIFVFLLGLAIISIDMSKK